jgi:hypothetical protein
MNILIYIRLVSGIFLGFDIDEYNKTENDIIFSCSVDSPQIPLARWWTEASTVNRFCVGLTLARRVTMCFGLHATFRLGFSQKRKRKNILFREWRDGQNRIVEGSKMNFSLQWFEGLSCLQDKRYYFHSFYLLSSSLKMNQPMISKKERIEYLWCNAVFC